MPAMSIRNMRENGVRSVLARCLDCHHEASLNLDGWEPALFIPDIARKLKCGACGSKCVTTRPNWTDPDFAAEPAGSDIAGI